LKRYAAAAMDSRGHERTGGGIEPEPRGGEGIRARGEEALGDLAQALIDNPVFSQAVTTAIGAGERAAAAQRSAMGALNIPAASDLERIEQRMRSLSTRLEAVEDQLDDALDELAALRRRTEERPAPPHAATDEVGAGQSSEG
jgi:hypothetical protein